MTIFTNYNSKISQLTKQRKNENKNELRKVIFKDL